MGTFFRFFVRIAHKIVDKIEELIDDIGDDELVQRGLEADLGLPVGALDKGKLKRPPTTGIDEYLNAVDPDPEKLAAAFEAIKAYAAFWTTVFDAAKTAAAAVQTQGVTGAIAAPLFQNYLIPFELTSVLLLTAIVGAVVLAKRRV